MAEATFFFPDDFMWGTATSSHQVEGNNRNNNWFAWEQEGHIKHDHTAGLACDWWSGRWREDFDRAEEGGHNAHRLSIEWSRVQPLPDRWDEDALDRYRDMVRNLRERNLTPLVTLQHFSEPLWLAEMGSWENDAVVQHFAGYTRKVVEALQEYVDIWVTINEPNVMTFSGYVSGDFPPGKQNLGIALQVIQNVIRSHAAAYEAIHRLQPKAQVGISHYYRDLQPAREWSPLDRLATRTQAGIFNNLVPSAVSKGILHFLGRRVSIPEAKNTQDYFGLDYYTSDRVAFSLFNPQELFGQRSLPEEVELSDTKFIANVPQGLFRALRWALHYDLPIIILENGLDDSEDVLRPRYLAEHIHQVWRAINFNWPVMGYFHWTLVDNFEWERGWTQRFGLWELDRESQVRRKRPSAEFYAEICRENGLSSDMVAKYAPEILPGMFPG